MAKHTPNVGEEFAYTCPSIRTDSNTASKFEKHEICLLVHSQVHILDEKGSTDAS